MIFVFVALAFFSIAGEWSNDEGVVNKTMVRANADTYSMDRLSHGAGKGALELSRVACAECHMGAGTATVMPSPMLLMSISSETMLAALQSTKMQEQANALTSEEKMKQVVWLARKKPGERSVSTATCCTAPGAVGSLAIASAD